MTLSSETGAGERRSLSERLNSGRLSGNGRKCDGAVLHFRLILNNFVAPLVAVVLRYTG